MTRALRLQLSEVIPVQPIDFTDVFEKKAAARGRYLNRSFFQCPPPTRKDVRRLGSDDVVGRLSPARGPMRSQASHVGQLQLEPRSRCHRCVE